MKAVFFALFLVPLAAEAADSPRAQLRAGLREYEQKQYEPALQQFEGAASGAATNHLDAAVPLYNAANSLMQLGRHPEASTRYQESLRSPDLALQARAYYNRGNALYRMAETPAPPPAASPAAAPQVPAAPAANLDSAAQAIEESLRMYERAMFLDPDDPDTKVNYELALRLQEQIQQQQQQQNQQQEEKKDEEQPQDKKEEQEKQDQEQEQQQQQEQPQEPQDQPSQQEPKPAEEMTPEEARMLLDRMKQEEQSYRDKMQVIMGRPVPVDKDW